LARCRSTTDRPAPFKGVIHSDELVVEVDVIRR
jgi:hypothetical protein